MTTGTWIDRANEREVRLEGDLDHAGCDELAQTLDGAMGGDVRTVILRMDKVGSICSRGVTVLLSTYHRLRRQGRTLLVTGLRPQVRDVLERLGVFQAVPEWDQGGVREGAGTGRVPRGENGPVRRIRRCATDAQMVDAVDARDAVDEQVPGTPRGISISSRFRG